MLCDELMASTLISYAGNTTLDEKLHAPLDEIKQSLRLAEKFVLSDDFSMAAQSVTLGRPSSVVDAIEYAKCPFQNVWIEWNGSLYETDPDLPPYRSPPVKVGVLIECDSGSFSSGVMSLAWKIRHDGETEVRVSSMKLKFDYSGNLRNSAKELSFSDLHPNARNEWTDAALRSQRELEAMRFLEACFRPFVSENSLESSIISMMPSYRSILELDWAGESPFIISCLILMNVRNGAQPIKSDLSVLNKRRIKQGKLPLFEYKTLTIGRKQHTPMSPSDAGDSERNSPRSHIVRGHFKTRKSGVFWWSPFRRGDSSNGSIAKRYKVEHESV